MTSRIWIVCSVLLLLASLGGVISDECLANESHGHHGKSTSGPSNTSGATNSSSNSSTLSNATEDTSPKPEEENVELSLLRAGILEFSYGDDDPKGPQNWEDLDTESASRCEFNCCGGEHSSPVNIDTSKTTLANISVETLEARAAQKRSLRFIFTDGIEKRPWTLGYPADTWHGIEIRSQDHEPGLFEVMDEYGVLKSTQYNFEFAQVTYCDPHTAAHSRSSHQIDGKKFPFEINMMFFGESLADDVCLRKSLRDENLNNFVMVSVLGEAYKDDNPRLEPLIEAAASFTGEPSFDNELLDGYTVPIPSPFSPTWFIKNATDYYFYERGTFPVPPCYVIPRVYVMKSTIPISERQLEVLVNIPSKREPSGKLACTFGVLQDRLTPESAHHNAHPIELVGNDGRRKNEFNGGERLRLRWLDLKLRLLLAGISILLSTSLIKV